MRVLSETDGKPSFSRWLPTVLAAVTVFIILHAVWLRIGVDSSVVELLKWLWPWSVAPYAVNKIKKNG